jgi:hypothetical protein
MVLQSCGVAVRERRKRFEVGGGRQNVKVQNPNDKGERLRLRLRRRSRLEGGGWRRKAKCQSSNAK